MYGSAKMKKLIIVCEEKYRLYGDFLAQLISGKDDQEDKIIGIKDGIAAAQVWTEKEYSSNAAQISSEQYLLFIGNSKLIKEKRHHMQQKYSEYGMNYGWLGKQAVLFIDRTLTYSEYQVFFQIATQAAIASNQSKLARLLPAKHIEAVEEAPVIDAEIVDNQNDTAEAGEPEPQGKKGKKKILVPINAAKVAIRKTADQGKDSINKMTESINAAAKSKEIEEQQYSCLVLLFYLNDLGNFLGVNEA